MPYKSYSISPQDRASRDGAETAPPETAPNPKALPSLLDGRRPPLLHCSVRPASLPRLCAWQVLTAFGWRVLPRQLALRT